MPRTVGKLGTSLEVEGLKELQAGLKAAGGKWPKELAKAHRVISKEVATQARQFAVGTSPQAAFWSKAITPSASASSASVGVRRQANAVFWGSKAHSGWYAAPQYADSPKGNNPPWVGNSWVAGGPGGPYAINDAVRFDLPQIKTHLLEAVEDVYRQAFPKN